MSPSTNQEGSHPDPVPHAPREQNTTLTLLWLVALMAVLGAGLAWYKQRQTSVLLPAATVPTQPATAPLPAGRSSDSASTTAAKKPGADARRRQNTPPQRTTAALPRTQGPRPLAGNLQPKYPVAALRAGIGGTVMVRAELDARGVPVDVDVVRRSGHRELDRAAMTAVRKWRFQPAMRNGRPVPSAVQVPVDFKPI